MVQSCKSNTAELYLSTLAIISQALTGFTGSPSGKHNKLQTNNLNSERLQSKLLSLYYLLHEGGRRRKGEGRRGMKRPFLKLAV